MVPRVARWSSRTFWAGALSLALVLNSSHVQGQTFPPDPVDRTVFTLQWEKPFFPGLGGLAAWSSILEADVIFRVGPGQSVQLGMPIAIAGADAVDGTSLFLHNLRFSVLFGEPGALNGFLGLTVPTASNVRGPDLAVVVGVLPYLEEFEKWGDDAFSVRGAWTPFRPIGGGQLGLRLGGAAVAPIDLVNVFVYARAAGWGRFPAGNAELRADLETSYLVNDDHGFGERFIAYLNLGAALSGAGGHPGLFIRIPLDADARDVLDFSIGLTARF